MNSVHVALRTIQRTLKIWSWNYNEEAERETEDKAENSERQQRRETSRKAPHRTFVALFWAPCCVHNEVWLLILTGSDTGQSLLFLKLPHAPLLFGLVSLLYYYFFYLLIVIGFYGFDSSVILIDLQSQRGKNTFHDIKIKSTEVKSLVFNSLLHAGRRFCWTHRESLMLRSRAKIPGDKSRQWQEFKSHLCFYRNTFSTCISVLDVEFDLHMQILQTLSVTAWNLRSLTEHTQHIIN